MELLVVPDIEGKAWMFDVAEDILKQIPEAGVCVFMNIGKCDNENNVREAYQRAMQFAKRYTKAYWVYGEAELSILLQQKDMPYIDFFKQIQTRATFIHQIDQLIFSASGVCQEFLREYPHRNKYAKWNPPKIIEHMNALGPIGMTSKWSPVHLWRDSSVKLLWQRMPYYQVVGNIPVIRPRYEDTRTISCNTCHINKDGTPYGTMEYIIINSKTGRWRPVPMENKWKPNLLK